MSTALVRYAAKRAAPMAIRYYGKRRFKRARLAGYAARAAYNYGPTAYRAGRKIVRWASKWGKRSNRSVKGRSTSVRAEISSGTNIPMRALNFDVIRFPASNSQANVNARENNIMHLSGIKVCHQFNSRFTTGFDNVEMHWALCQQKQEGVLDQAYIRSEFFKDNSIQGAADQVRSFIDAAAGTNYDFRYQCLPINTGRFNVLTHKRRIICPNNSNTQATGRNVWKINKYFKINKKIAFNDMADEVGKCPWFVVYWYQSQTPEGWPADPPNSLNIQSIFNYQTYMREIK